MSASAQTGQAGAAVLDDGAEVVDAVDVVGVGVGEGDAVEEAGAGGEELRAQVGGGVDQRAGGARGGGALEEEGAAAAAVLRVFRVAVAPVAADAGDAGGGAAAEDLGGRRCGRRGWSVWQGVGMSLVWLLCGRESRVEGAGMPQRARLAGAGSRGSRRRSWRFERRSPACAGSAPEADGLRPCALLPGGARVARGGPSPAPLDPPGTAR